MHTCTYVRRGHERQIRFSHRWLARCLHLEAERISRIGKGGLPLQSPLAFCWIPVITTWSDLSVGACYLDKLPKNWWGKRSVRYSCQYRATAAPTLPVCKSSNLSDVVRHLTLLPCGLRYCVCLACFLVSRFLLLQSVTSPGGEFSENYLVNQCPIPTAVYPRELTDTK